VSGLDKERSALKNQMENILAKIGFNITPEFLEKFQHA
jgi:hypothetical protein